MKTHSHWLVGKLPQRGPLFTVHWPRITLAILLFAVAALFAAGCASPGVNPSKPRANMGYVDFYSDSSGELGWGVACFDDHNQAFKPVFSEIEPLPGRVLRLAFAPGHHRVRISFLNLAVREPAEFEVVVLDGMVTPVHVVVTADGTIQMENREQRFGTTARGRYRHATTVSISRTALHRISVETNVPRSYTPKEQMPYAR
jgi:hypothetical protein